MLSPAPTGLGRPIGTTYTQPEETEGAGKAHFEERRAVLHCDRDEEARPRSGYRPRAPGGRQVEHVDEHLRAAAWMGAPPLPPAWCRLTNLHAGRDHHSRDRGCRDRAHRSTSQPRLTPGPLHPRTPRRTRGLHRHGSPTSLLMRTPGLPGLGEGGPFADVARDRVAQATLESARRMFLETCPASASSTPSPEHIGETDGLPSD